MATTPHVHLQPTCETSCILDATTRTVQSQLWLMSRSIGVTRNSVDNHSHCSVTTEIMDDWLPSVQTALGSPEVL